MNSRHPAAALAEATLVDRYQVEGLLGHGGMATVYQVYDRITGRRVALKRLQRPNAHAEHVVRMFELEYHTVSQLAHPSIIEAYDYHTDAQGPFYTMQLLTGGDLRQRSPVAWAELCRLLCEVCSALALLHSRRLVHRDLTPWNVRCTTDGRAKLFDFGSMTQFGRAKNIVGTPPFIAPEALNGDILDGRTDLFALGATAYHALTGRHAYPAHNLTALPEFWLAPPPAPSQCVPGVPSALDDLIMALLSLSPRARPLTAAEVMERLSAIGGFELQEALRVRESYLAAPTLTARERELSTFRRKLERLAQGHGGVLLVTGAPGTGRSRLLDACALEAKLSGALVLRSDARRSASERWAAAGRIFEDLSQQLPDLSADLLGPRKWPLARSLSGRSLHPQPADEPLASAANDVAEPESGQPKRAEVQAALLACAIELARRRVLVLVVDDIDHIDEPSAALFALLASQSEQRLLILAAAGDEREGSAPEQRALRLLVSVATRLRLGNLTREDLVPLVVSLFGDVPNVRLLSDRIFAATNGNPKLVMRVAQHLVQRGACRYAGGAWTLTADIHADTLSGAFIDRVDPTLAQTAIELARGLALSKLPWISFDESVALCAHGDLKQLQSDVHVLAAAGIITLDEHHISLSGRSWEPLLLADCAPELRRELHLRIAGVLEGRPGTAAQFRRLQHLLRAGEVEAALDLLLADLRAHRAARVRDADTSFEYVQSLPKDWAETFHQLIEGARQLRRPLHDRLSIQQALVGYATLTARSERACMLEVATQLRHDTGLDLIPELCGRVPESELLARALTQASQRYEAAIETERGWPLATALTELAQLIVQAIGMGGRTFDLALLQALPSLAPVSALSPALALVQQNLESSMEVLAGRGTEVHDRFLEIADRLEQPDGGGLTDAHRKHMHCAALWVAGLIEAEHGQPRALERADAIESNPLFKVSALKLRGLYALTRGDRATAERYRAQTELLNIEDCPPQLFEGADTLRWTVAYAMIGDLSRVKHCLAEVEALARDHLHWREAAHCARGIYQKLRGDHGQALLELEQGLTQMHAGRHVAWTLCAGEVVWALNHQHRYAEAQARGLELLTSLEAARIHGASHLVLVPLAFAESQLGHCELALQHVQRAIDLLSFASGSSVMLGQAYEVRAYIALQTRDAAAFSEYAAACDTQYRPGEHSLLVARYERLLRCAREAGLASEAHDDPRARAAHTEAELLVEATTLIGSAQGPSERAKRVLELIARIVGRDSGFLYLVQSAGPTLVAQLGRARPAPALDTAVSQYLFDAVERAEDTQTLSLGPVRELGSSWTDDAGRRYAPVVVSHPREAGVFVSGVAVLPLDSSTRISAPARVLHVLSRALHEVGDVATLREPGQPNAPFGQSR